MRKRKQKKIHHSFRGLASLTPGQGTSLVLGAWGGLALQGIRRLRRRGRRKRSSGDLTPRIHIGARWSRVGPPTLPCCSTNESTSSQPRGPCGHSTRGSTLYRWFVSTSPTHTTNFFFLFFRKYSTIFSMTKKKKINSWAFYLKFFFYL